MSTILPVEERSEAVIPVSVIVSSTALLVACLTAAWVAVGDPWGKGIDKYDMSTPKAALLSGLEIQSGPYTHAKIDYLVGNPRVARALVEKRRTVEVHRETEWKGNKVLFISFEENGIKKRTVEFYEKDAETGLFWPNLGASFGMIADQISNDPAAKAMAERVKNWTDKGILDS